MTDLVQRLREWAEDAYQHNSHFIPVSEATLREAADEIEHLTTERDAFYMDYRMKCDAETKALAVERDALRKDAERLLWIACNAELKAYAGAPGQEQRNLARLRSAIDAAMFKG